MMLLDVVASQCFQLESGDKTGVGTGRKVSTVVSSDAHGGHLSALDFFADNKKIAAGVELGTESTRLAGVQISDRALHDGVNFGLQGDGEATKPHRIPLSRGPRRGNRRLYRCVGGHLTLAACRLASGSSCNRTSMVQRG